MATLKEHQAAMVDLLANGSGIPASASRLAHAMHDVLGAIINGSCSNTEQLQMLLNDATTPGLNDKTLSKPHKALKTDSPAKWPTPAEQRVKELENTIRQLKANNVKLRKQIADNAPAVDLWSRWSATPPEQAGCRKPGEEPHDVASEALKVGADYAELGMKYAELVKILAFYGVDDLDKARAEYLKYNELQEQAGCRKEDTQVCEHVWQQAIDSDFRECIKCQTIEDIYE